MKNLFLLSENRVVIAEYRTASKSFARYQVRSKADKDAPWKILNIGFTYDEMLDFFHNLRANPDDQAYAYEYAVCQRDLATWQIVNPNPENQHYDWMDMKTIADIPRELPIPALEKDWMDAFKFYCDPEKAAGSMYY